MILGVATSCRSCHVFFRSYGEPSYPKYEGRQDSEMMRKANSNLIASSAQEERLPRAA